MTELDEAKETEVINTDNFYITVDVSKPRHHFNGEFTMKPKLEMFDFEQYIEELNDTNKSDKTENVNYNCPQCDSSDINVVYNLDNDLCKYCHTCKHGLDDGYYEYNRTLIRRDTKKKKN